jgi:hypothetical protein
MHTPKFFGLALLAGYVPLATAMGCGSLGGPGQTVDWHANTDPHYGQYGAIEGGNANDICGCLDLVRPSLIYPTLSVPE